MNIQEVTKYMLDEQGLAPVSSSDWVDAALTLAFRLQTLTHPKVKTEQKIVSQTLQAANQAQQAIDAMQEHDARRAVEQAIRTIARHLPEHESLEIFPQEIAWHRTRLNENLEPNGRMWDAWVWNAPVGPEVAAQVIIERKKHPEYAALSCRTTNQDQQI